MFRGYLTRNTKREICGLTGYLLSPYPNPNPIPNPIPDPNPDPNPALTLTLTAWWQLMASQSTATATHRELPSPPPSYPPTPRRHRGAGGRFKPTSLTAVSSIRRRMALLSGERSLWEQTADVPPHRRRSFACSPG